MTYNVPNLFYVSGGREQAKTKFSSFFLTWKWLFSGVLLHLTMSLNIKRKGFNSKRRFRRRDRPRISRFRTL